MAEELESLHDVALKALGKTCPEQGELWASLGAVVARQALAKASSVVRDRLAKSIVQRLSLAEGTMFMSLEAEPTSGVSLGQWYLRPLDDSASDEMRQLQNACVLDWAQKLKNVTADAELDSLRWPAAFQFGGTEAEAQMQLNPAVAVSMQTVHLCCCIGPDCDVKSMLGQCSTLSRRSGEMPCRFRLLCRASPVIKGRLDRMIELADSAGQGRNFAKRVAEYAADADTQDRPPVILLRKLLDARIEAEFFQEVPPEAEQQALEAFCKASAPRVDALGAPAAELITWLHKTTKSGIRPLASTEAAAEAAAATAETGRPGEQATNRPQASLEVPADAAETGATTEAQTAGAGVQRSVEMEEEETEFLGVASGESAQSLEPTLQMVKEALGAQISILPHVFSGDLTCRSPYEPERLGGLCDCLNFLWLCCTRAAAGVTEKEGQKMNTREFLKELQGIWTAVSFPQLPEDRMAAAGQDMATGLIAKLEAEVAEMEPVWRARLVDIVSSAFFDWFEGHDKPGTKVQIVEEEAKILLDLQSHPEVTAWALAADGLNGVIENTLEEVDAMMTTCDTFLPGLQRFFDTLSYDGERFNMKVPKRCQSRCDFLDCFVCSWTAFLQPFQEKINEIDRIISCSLVRSALRACEVWTWEPGSEAVQFFAPGDRQGSSSSSGSAAEQGGGKQLAHTLNKLCAELAVDNKFWGASRDMLRSREQEPKYNPPRTNSVSFESEFAETKKAHMQIAEYMDVRLAEARKSLHILMAADIFLAKDSSVPIFNAATGVKKYIEAAGHRLEELPLTLQNMLQDVLKKGNTAPSAAGQSKGPSKSSHMAAGQAHPAAGQAHPEENEKSNEKQDKKDRGKKEKKKEGKEKKEKKERHKEKKRKSSDVKQA